MTNDLDAIDPAVMAAIEAMDKDIEDYSTRKHDRSPSNERMAEVAVAAARPIIEAETRKKAFDDVMAINSGMGTWNNGDHLIWRSLAAYVAGGQVNA